MYIVLLLSGCDVTPEIEMNTGRIDAVLECPNLIYIIEFKLSNSKAAVAQILDKVYIKPYLNLNKPKYLLGFSFNTSRRNINEEYTIIEVN